MKLHPRLVPAFLAAVAAVPSLASSQTALFTAPGVLHGGALGTSVAMLGDVTGDGKPDLLVGAPFDDVQGIHAGRVRLHSGKDGSVIRVHLGLAAGDQLGFAVASLGADASGDGFTDYLIGSPFADAGGLASAGSVTLYNGATGAAIRTYNGAAAGDHFGSSIASLGLVAGVPRFAVGAPGASPGGLAGAGTVTLFSSTSTTALHQFDGGAAGAALGTSLDAGQDFNHDGLLDVAAGAPGAASAIGHVLVVSGSTPFATLLDLQGGAVGEHFGSAIALLADTNNDTFADLAVGEPVANGSGRVRIFGGPAGSLLKTLTIASPVADDAFGFSVAFAGDFDGDGRGDVVVGAPGRDPAAATDAGAIFVFSGSTGALLQSSLGATPGARLGTSVSRAVDANADGKRDFAGGEPFVASNGPFAGRISLFSGANGAALWSSLGPTVGDLHGSSVSAIGDVSGDGISEYVVGTPRFTLASGSPPVPAVVGKVERHDGATGQVFSTIFGSENADELGASVAGVGDVNLDGVPDFAIGVPRTTKKPAQAGRVLVFSGSGGSLLFGFDGTQPGDAYGASVAAAGDLDADGRPDVLIGAPLFDIAGASNAGRVEARSGANGAVLLNVLGTGLDEQLGISVAPVGADLNGDGHLDIVAAAQLLNANTGGALVLSAPSTLVHTITPPFFGYVGRAVAAGADLDADGKPDLVLGMLAPTSGRAVAFSGATFAPMWQDSGFGGFFNGCSVATLGDLDVDGSPEVIVGAIPANGSTDLGGHARILTGRTGQLMEGVTGWTGGDLFGTSVARISDLDGDGFEDFLVGAPKVTLAQPFAGAAFAYTSRFQGADAFGPGTPGCAGAQHMTMNLAPIPGTPDFALRVDHAPPSSIGLAILATDPDIAGTDLLGLGVLSHVSFGSALVLGLNASSDAAGHGTVPFPLPQIPQLEGFLFYAQTFWFWGTSCAPLPFGLSSSRGLKILTFTLG